MELQGSAASCREKPPDGSVKQTFIIIIITIPPSNIAPKQGLIAPNCLEVVYVWPYIVHSRHITKAHVLIVS